MATENTAEKLDIAPGKIVVAMSGGVDSSAAAIMLHDAGYEVVGISMQVWDYRKHGGNSGKATCCAPADFEDAREIAEQKGFPFYVFDFEDSFYDSVIDPFINSYLQGYTPNPCLDCNRKVKFRQLRQRARSLGVTQVATGHYAQIKSLANGELGLFTAVDTDKDQTYFLYAMSQQDLHETLFPLGAMRKPDVRRFLEKKETSIADKGESFDICFVSQSVADFIEQEKGLEKTPGSIVNTSGKVLGQHDGVYRYTVGQRKGLGLSNPNPLYVIQVNAEENQIVVGEREELQHASFIVRDVHWISDTPPAAGLRCLVRLRYRHVGALCEVEVLPDNRAKLSFVDQWTTVSPGQAAVFYSDAPDEAGDYQVFGGGIIEKL